MVYNTSITNVTFSKKNLFKFEEERNKVKNQFMFIGNKICQEKINRCIYEEKDILCLGVFKLAKVLGNLF